MKSNSDLHSPGVHAGVGPQQNLQDEGRSFRGSGSNLSLHSYPNKNLFGECQPPYRPKIFKTNDENPVRFPEIFPENITTASNFNLHTYSNKDIAHGFTQDMHYPQPSQYAVTDYLNSPSQDPQNFHHLKNKTVSSTPKKIFRCDNTQSDTNIGTGMGMTNLQSGNLGPDLQSQFNFNQSRGLKGPGGHGAYVNGLLETHHKKQRESSDEKAFNVLSPVQSGDFSNNFCSSEEKLKWPEVGDQSSAKLA